MVVKIKKDYSYLYGWIYIYLCEKCGCTSDKALRCPCLRHYPQYEYGGEE